MVRILAVITTLILFASTSLPAFAQTPVNAFQMEFLSPIQLQTDHAIFETAALLQDSGNTLDLWRSATMCSAQYQVITSHLLLSVAKHTSFD